MKEVGKKMNLPYSYLCKVGVIESNLNPLAKNPRSSARGLFQIIKSTERTIRKRYKVKGSIYNPRVNTVMMGYLMKEQGIMKSYTGMYLMHFFGKQVGTKIMDAHDSALVKDVAPRAYYFNKKLIGNKTKKEFVEFIEKKLDSIKGCD